MPVLPYCQSIHSFAIFELFKKIYPDWSYSECKKMAYDEKNSIHLLTLVAFSNNLAVGQMNVFRVGPNCELGNIGYHVHPDWQRKCIASLLLFKTWGEIKNKFSDGFIVQTSLDNIPSINFATKYGFKKTPGKILDEYSDYLKFKKIKRGISYHLSIMNDRANKELEKCARIGAIKLGG